MTGLVKWIRAEVARPSAFDAAQRRWQRIAGFPGLLGQHGGWSAPGRDRAVIVAAWTGRPAHDAFLATAHDDIAEAQRPTYTALTVHLLDVETDVGSAPPAGVLRTAACRLRPGRLGHAVDVQREVWLPAMREAGMLRGLVARGAPGPDGAASLVVLTWWPTRAGHDRYQRERVPGLRAEADVTADFTAVEGDLVVLEPHWTVPGT